MSTALDRPAPAAPAAPGEGPPAPGSGRRERLRGWLRTYAPYVLLGVALIVVVVVTDRPPDHGLPLDPRSPGPLGTKGLVDVLTELGTDVRIQPGIPAEPGGAALLLSDRLDPAGRELLLGWVRAGGVLVVADATSELQPEFVAPTALGFTDPSIARGECALAALADVGRVTAPGGSVYEVPDGAVGCFSRNDGSWLVARQEGDGVVVTVGGPATFTNAELGSEDNALLAVVLLAPEGEGAVTFLEPPSPGGGGVGLFDLISPPVRLAILQLLIAFAIVVLWRARRLGRPVVEASPVEVPGSELVVAVGNLFQASGAHAHAAGLLRADARRFLAERLGVPHDAPPEVIAEAAVARTEADAGEVLALVDPAPGPADDAGLVALAQAVERVRRATLSGPGGAAPPQDVPIRGAARVH